ncbi:MAG: hypothetical protein K2H74_05130, partial [Paramuribaculum sp.]|nr:hypothetical protein [Paramuribaculum sp.]
MSTSQPSLSVPYLPELSNTDPSEIIALLDNKGASITIDCINWPKEYPYHPFTDVAIAHSGKSIFVNFQVRGNYLR